MNDERFEQLWQGLREQVRAARGGREPINTMQHLPFVERTIFGGEVRVGKGDEDGSNLRLSGTKFTASANVSDSDLLSIAAQCVAAAIEIEDAKEDAEKVRPTTQQRA